MANGTWDENRIHVNEELRRLAQKLDSLQQSVNELSIALGGMKAEMRAAAAWRGAAWGIGAALVVTIVGQLVRIVLT